MKNTKKKRLLGLIPVLTTIASIIYIGVAIEQDKSVAENNFSKFENLAYRKKIDHAK